MKKILTIAGYDPSSGAGVTKDLEIISALGMHGISVPTCIVLQGPQGVRDVYPVPYAQFYEMVDMAGEAFPIDGIKIGALWNEAYVQKVASFLYGIDESVPVVLDPIIAAKNGTILLSEDGVKQMVELIFPMAALVTPNIPEASLITGKEIHSMEDMKACAGKVFAMGPKAVIIKGGHLKGEPVDLFYNGEDFKFYKKQRIDREVHGTGCIFSSLMTAFLVLGLGKDEAFQASEKQMEALLADSYRIDADGYFYASSAITNKMETIRP